MRSAVVLMTGFALLVAGVLVLALTGATMLGVALLAVGILTKAGGLLLGEPSARSVGPAASRPSGGGSARPRASARGVAIRARRPVHPATPTPSAHGRRRAS